MDPQKILETLRSLSEQRLPTEGLTDPSGSLGLEEVLKSICELESYGGGYMYGGGYASLNGKYLFHYRCHLVREYDNRQPLEFEEHNKKVLEAAPEGVILRIGKSAQIDSFEDYRKAGDQWVSIGGYNGTDYDCARQHMNWRGFYLWQGVRKEVAEVLGYQYDDLFHHLFDQVVEQTI
jgi:hypothetical protein